MLILTSGGVPRHQVKSSTFEFLHTYCCKSLNEAYMCESMYMLKSSSPLCCQFLHLFPMFVFGIVKFLLGGRESIKLCVFKLHHRVRTNVCDDFL
jgi:hypothetical protein